MTKELRSIMDVTPATPKNWKIKVTVLEKGTISESRNKLSRYQHFVLADSDGAKVQLTLFDPVIEMFSDRLHLFRTYYISNATVRPVELKYQIANHPYQWTLNSLCTVAETTEGINVSNRLFEFVSIDNLPNFRSSDSTVDVLVIVIQMLAQKKVSNSRGDGMIQECVVVDKSLKPIILTFWEKFLKTEVAELVSTVDQKPILLGNRLKVSSYDGLSLSSKSGSTFSINPIIPPARELRAWMEENMAMVNSLVNLGGLVSKARNYRKDLTSQFITLEIVQRSHHLNKFQVRTRLEIQDYEQTVVQNACNNPKCHKPTLTVLKETYICNHCRKEVVSVPKLRVHVRLSDKTGFLMATMSEVAAEIFLRCSVAVLFQNHTLDTPRPFRSLVDPDTNTEMAIDLRAYDSGYHGITTRRYHVASIQNTGNNASDNIEDESSTHACSTSFPVDLCDPELTMEEKQLLQKMVQRKKARVQSYNSSSLEESNASHSEYSEGHTSTVEQDKVTLNQQ